MDRSGTERVRARRVAACTIVLVAVCGCAADRRGGGIAFNDNDPSHVSEVVPAKLYRSGQLTAYGLEQAIAQYGIRTVINLRGEEPDPDLGGGQGEREFCAAHGVRYVHLGVHPERDDLFPTGEHPERPLPPFVQEFLNTMDDPANCPVLIHCAGGKHRTGLLAASYRIVNQDYSAAQASAEMMSYGFETSDFRKNPAVMPFLEYLAAHPDPDATRSAAFERVLSD
jgi:protein tyrosine/serine phosphatase